MHSSVDWDLSWRWKLLNVLLALAETVLKGEPEGIKDGFDLHRCERKHASGMNTEHIIIDLVIFLLPLL